MSADPPWLDEAALEAARAYIGFRLPPGSAERHLIWREVAHAVLAFGARQPREITKEMIEAAAKAFCCSTGCILPDNCVVDAESCREARLVLEAAEKARG